LVWYLVSLRTKIVCIRGAASSSLNAIRSMADHGMDAVSLCLPHRDHQSHRDFTQKSHKVAEAGRVGNSVLDGSGRLGDGSKGDVVGVTAGAPLTIGRTNLFKIGAV
jgi:hypothetical protein